jgi:NAD(P)-dependent dehydrogenase (short-subunit alcohol dehydrogenase family)
MSMFDLKGRTALVTGATQGIGLAIAQALTHHGARLILSDRDEAACIRVAQELQKAGHDVVPSPPTWNTPSRSTPCAIQLDPLMCWSAMQAFRGPPAPWLRSPMKTGSK